MYQSKSLGVLSLLFLLWSTGRACTREELQMVQIISKECSVAPIKTYPTDPNPATIWKEGLKDLTMLGKFQAYALGVRLKNIYGDFITSDPRELQVFSSATKSAVKSTQSLVTALYSPSPYWEVVQNFTWQPIYINYDNEYDHFLSKLPCPSLDLELDLLISKEMRALPETYQNLMYYWSANSGVNLQNVNDVRKLFNILLTEFAHNLTIPEWSQTYWNELEYLHHKSLSLRTKTAKLIRLQGGSLVYRIIDAMKQKTQNSQDSTKVLVYGSHTFPLLGLMAAVDVKESDYLPPCSTLMVELYKTEGEYFVRFLFLNSTLPQREPQPIYSISMPGCTEYCPLEYVIDYTNDVNVRNRELECSSI